jgi:16S rRNA C967 or C1407 C5-methylase (RsmB/RsmF family)/NOL1/NOP2/fmu family ribosome biogenesis protein
VKQLPEALVKSLQNVSGFDKESFEESHRAGIPVTSIRINPAKFAAGKLKYKIQDTVPWSPAGVYLTERPSFTIDPYFHAGAYYVQEASSMFLEEVLKQTTDLSQPLKVLDLCAAPGGKSTLIQSLLNEDSFLVSNEVIKPRVSILAENITKWGAANVVVTNNDPKDFQRLQNYFDVIVVDAPCSGSGLFRKDADAINEWSENNVLLCSQRQQRILADVMPALKINGVLIYSTCSYSKQEDEDIAGWLVNEHAMKSLPLKTEIDWSIVETTSAQHGAYGYRFYPDKIKGEGFFIAAFKKTDGRNFAVQENKTKQKPEKISAAELNAIKPFLKTPASFFYIKQQNTVLALPLALQHELHMLQSSLYIKKAGIKMGTVIRNELVPEHELAVSTAIHHQLQSIEADETVALQYLRRHDFKIDTALKGRVLLSYKNLPLGWMKVLPNRINNYYPVNWRIVNK